MTVLLGLTGALGGACFFGDDSEPVEFLKRENAIIIQVLDVGPGLSRLEQRLTLPSFTLYGDGTLILSERGDGPQLLHARMPEEAVQDLVEFVAGEGFLDLFAFEEPGVDAPDDAATTYLYLNTKQGANSVRAIALDGVVGDDDHARLAGIKERLEQLDVEALGGRVVGPFEPEQVALFVRAVEPPDPDADVRTWPLREIDLASAVEPGSPIGKELVPIERASALVASGSSGLAMFEQGDLFFEVGYRPALPFEENFPEFDFP